MADWTIGTGSNPSHGRSRGGAATPLIRYFEESTCASTAVIKLGDIVALDTVVSTGGPRVVRAPAGGGNGANLLLTNALVGVAAEGSTSDGSTAGLLAGGSAGARGKKIGVFTCEPDAEYLGYLSAGASHSTQIGTQKAVRYDSTNHVYMIDSTNSTAALAFVTITDIPDQHVGDTNGPVYFKFLSSNVSAVVA